MGIGWIIAFSVLLVVASCQSGENDPKMDAAGLVDGIYPLIEEITDSMPAPKVEAPNLLIFYNHKFLTGNPQTVTHLIIDTSDFVPLVLESEPDSVQQEDKRIHLLLNLAKKESRLFEDFTARHLNGKIAMVINGEALTKHKIRSVIKGGKIQVTRCTDSACTYLFYELKDNVLKEL